jgi:hypothetical protein
MTHVRGIADAAAKGCGVVEDPRTLDNKHFFFPRPPQDVVLDIFPIGVPLRLITLQHVLIVGNGLCLKEPREEK